MNLYLTEVVAVADQVFISPPAAPALPELPPVFECKHNEFDFISSFQKYPFNHFIHSGYHSR